MMLGECSGQHARFALRMKWTFSDETIRFDFGRSINSLEMHFSWTAILFLHKFSIKYSRNGCSPIVEQASLWHTNAAWKAQNFCFCLTENAAVTQTENICVHFGVFFYQDLSKLKQCAGMHRASKESDCSQLRVSLAQMFLRYPPHAMTISPRRCLLWDSKLI